MNLSKILKYSKIVSEIPAESNEAKLVKSFNLGIVGDNSTVDEEFYEIYTCEFQYEDGEVFEETYAIRIKQESETKNACYLVNNNGGANIIVSYENGSWFSADISSGTFAGADIEDTEAMAANLAEYFPDETDLGGSSYEIEEWFGMTAYEAQEYDNKNVEEFNKSEWTLIYEC